MNLFNRSILPFLMVATFFDLFLVGCLDAPSNPDALKPVESINVLIKQKGSSYSTQLKVHPSDSATIRAEVIPDNYQDDLSFEWFYSNGKKDSLLRRGATYTFYPTKGATKDEKNKGESVIPNKLIATDNEGNSLSKEFSVIINSLPVLADSTVPADGDTLYGSKTSAFLFDWYSYDMDLNNGDTLFHTLDIDGVKYEVGTLMQVKQSGFEPGKHKFRIIVRDLYGDADTLPYKKFYVIDTLEAK